MGGEITKIDKLKDMTLYFMDDRGNFMGGGGIKFRDFASVDKKMPCLGYRRGVFSG